MILEEEREKIVDYGKRLIKHGLTRGTGGNLSIYNRSEKRIAISPSGIDYFEVTPEDVVILDLHGNVIDGHREPSSEVSMHLVYYNRRDDIEAIIHTHSNYATTISCMNWDLPAVHYMVAVAGENVRCAEYATYGTPELAENAFIAMTDRRAVLLANHGLLAGGSSIEDAFQVSVEIEFCAEMYYRAKSIGDPVILSEEEMTVMHERFKTYGQAGNLR